jgi:hypothetical protein
MNEPFNLTIDWQFVLAFLTFRELVLPQSGNRAGLGSEFAFWTVEGFGAGRCRSTHCHLYDLESPASDNEQHEEVLEEHASKPVGCLGGWIEELDLDGGVEIEEAPPASKQCTGFPGEMRMIRTSHPVRLHR